MSDDSGIGMEEAEGSLRILSDIFIESSDGESNWEIQPIDNERILLQTKACRKRMLPSQNGISKISVDFLSDLLMGLNRRQWSGVVAVDTGMGVCRIYFSDGEVCFAGSNVMDHRLGEVIYRNGVISLDQLTDYTVQVTRQLKFGQVLLRGGLFNVVDLWEALKMQVLEIIKYSFLFPEVYLELSEGKNLAPTEVVFSNGTQRLLNESYSYGCMFREFVGRLQMDAAIKVNHANYQTEEYVEGSFLGDILALVNNDSKLSSVLESSKLLDINTYAALMTLVNCGVCDVTDGITAQVKTFDGISDIKSRIDAYAVIMKSARQAFQQQGKEFPHQEMKDFLKRLNPHGFVSIFMNEASEFHAESILNIYSQCEGNPRRVRYFAIRLEALIQFVLQLVGDMLPYEVAKIVKGNFRKIRA